MALIKCQECGKEFSDKAGACIHCGCPIEIEETKKTITCNECGNKLNENEKVCNKCGCPTEIEKEVAKNNSQQSFTQKNKKDKSTNKVTDIIRYCVGLFCLLFTMSTKGFGIFLVLLAVALILPITSKLIYEKANIPKALRIILPIILILIAITFSPNFKKGFEEGLNKTIIEGEYLQTDISGGSLTLYKNGTCNWVQKFTLYDKVETTTYERDTCSYDYNSNEITLTYIMYKGNTSGAFKEKTYNVTCSYNNGTIDCGNEGKYSKNKKDDDTSKNNQTTNTNEKTQEEKNEEMYSKAKQYLNNKEYSYAYQLFNFVREYKDTNNILNSDKYLKLGGNKYSKLTNDYKLSFDFSTSTLYITYSIQTGGDSKNGACKIVDTRVYLEQNYQKGDYTPTDWYITNVNDNSIVVKKGNATFTLDKE